MSDLMVCTKRNTCETREPTGIDSFIVVDVAGDDENFRPAEITIAMPRPMSRPMNRNVTMDLKLLEVKNEQKKIERKPPKECEMFVSKPRFQHVEISKTYG